MTDIVAIDPGNRESAWCRLVNGVPVRFAKEDNAEVVKKLKIMRADYCDALVVEKIESFGMAVGAEVFETVFWSGRFCEAWAPHVFERIGRKDVKLHLCHSMRAKDANIRQAIIDRFGGPEAIGKKKSPGPLYEVSGDVWSALAVGLVWLDKHQAE